MPPESPSEHPKLVALVHTTDVDESVAGFSQVLGFGPFELPIAGPFTAIVGRNGTGKSRFLASIGNQTELVFSMPQPAYISPPPTYIPSPLDSDATIRIAAPKQPTLWGLAPPPPGPLFEDHQWLTPDSTGLEYRGVRSIWWQHPRDRFLHFLKLMDGTTLRERVAAHLRLRDLQEGSEDRSESFEDDQLTSEFTADVLERLERASVATRHVAAYAATAMYLCEHQIDKNLFADLYVASIGLELAEFSRVGITGATTNERQKIRFYFQDNRLVAPSCDILLRTQEMSDNIWNDDYIVPQPLERFLDFVDRLMPINYTVNDVYAQFFAGLSWRFTPQLPLALDGCAGVIHEGTAPSLWLEGIAAIPLQGGNWQHAVEVRNTQGDDGGALSWRFSLPDIELSWSEETGPDGNEVLHLGVLVPSENIPREWQSTLIHHSNTPSEIVFGFCDDLLIFCERAVRAVNAVASVIFENPPVALIDPSDGVLRWRFIKHGPVPESSRDVLELGDLSFAEQRWMRFANVVASRLLDRVLAAYGTDADRDWIDGGALEQLSPGVFRGCDLVMVIDEPEAGLHPTATDRLARGLKELAETLGIHYVVATHSPNVLRVVQAASGTIAHSHIDQSGQRVFQTVSTSELNSFADDLGLNSVDLLQMTSTFLFVEGEHDRIVINNLIGDDLRRSGVVTTPLRGALKVSQIVDSDLVWRFTDARLVVVLDSIDAEQMSEIVTEARRHLAEGDPRAAIDSLDPLKRDRTSKGKTEREALYELLHAAVSANRIERLEIFGLQEPDIIDYFHPRELAPTHTDSEYFSLGRREAWDALHTRYMNTPKRERKNAGFKTWAVEMLGIGSDPGEVLRNASANLDHIPDDFVRLRDLLCSVKPLRH